MSETVRTSTTTRVGCDADIQRNVETNQAGNGYPTLAAEGDDVTAAENGGITPFVTVTRQFTGNAPAQLRITLLNRSRQEREVAFGASPPFSEYWNENATDARLYIVPEYLEYVNVVAAEDGESIDGRPENPVDGCWQIETVERLDILERRTLDPCDAISETYTVFGGTTNDICVPTDDYRFENSWYTTGSESEEISIEWGFDLVVTDSE